MNAKTKKLLIALGCVAAAVLLFFAGFCFMLPIIFSLSVAVSKLSNKVKRLTQEIALLSEKEGMKDEKEVG